MEGREDDYPCEPEGKDEVEEVIILSDQCGIGPFKPSFLQKCTDPRFFTASLAYSTAVFGAGKESILVNLNHNLV